MPIAPSSFTFHTSEVYALIMPNYLLFLNVLSHKPVIPVSKESDKFYRGTEMVAGTFRRSKTLKLLIDLLFREKEILNVWKCSTLKEKNKHFKHLT